METEVYVYLASIVMLFVVALMLFISVYSPQPVVKVYREDPYRRGHWRRRRYDGVPGFY